MARVSYASRDQARAEAFCRDFGGARAYGHYAAAIDDPDVDAVVVAVPPAFHKALTLQALAAGKHVLVEKPAFPALADYHEVIAARDRAGRVVLVGENDHYKPLAVRLRQLVADGRIGEMVFAHFTTIAHRLKTADDWRNDEAMAGGDAFFEEGIHWLHIAGSLGPRIVSAHGYRPPASRTGPDRRAKSMMVAFRYDNDAVGALYYSREVPSLFRGLRLSKLFGRQGVITFESNGVFVFTRGRGWPSLHFPGFRDMRGYRAMYRDFARGRGLGPRAGDEPRARGRRPAADGPDLRLGERAGARGPVRRRDAEPVSTPQFDVVIVGSGAGGGTMAWALADSGARVLVLERGDYVPREPENWDPAAVWRHLRYRTTEQWVDERGVEFQPYTHYCVGGNTKFWGSVLYRLRARGLRRPRAPRRRVAGVADRLRRRWRRTTIAPSGSSPCAARPAIDPTDPPRGPFPFPAMPARAADGGAGRAAARRRPAPVVAAAGTAPPRRTRRLPAVQHLQLVSVPACMRRATPKSAASAPALARPGVTLWTGTRARRLLTNAVGIAGRGGRGRARRRSGAGAAPGWSSWRAAR